MDDESAYQDEEREEEVLPEKRERAKPRKLMYVTLGIGTRVTSRVVLEAKV